MPDEPNKIDCRKIPSAAGQISAVASANTPFIYFEDAAFYGLVNGVGKVALTTNRLIAAAPDGSVLADKVLVCPLGGKYSRS